MIYLFFSLLFVEMVEKKNRIQNPPLVKVLLLLFKTPLRKLLIIGIHCMKRGGVQSDAVKMLRPSFGKPGECFPLKENNGFVEINLRTAIIPEAITLEHVSEVCF
ncbi:hypothetical protein L6452_05658 [Arctium lappa]|uniref:Uncharacterized protein n=1 Tax=Arctium lappa TaxID=4217 RepID=A0ACB9EHB7_ARCLA|nr:hypothetical protein L6452_05658 [Arctium lappa]